MQLGAYTLSYTILCPPQKKKNSLQNRNNGDFLPPVRFIEALCSVQLICFLFLFNPEVLMPTKSFLISNMMVEINAKIHLLALTKLQRTEIRKELVFKIQNFAKHF